MAGISAKQVKELRDKTGAGMMDCKKALSETEGDVEKAVDYLRKKGLASAGKKSGRLASEGLVDSYIHFGGQIGVMVEVNCETDFVARNDAFKGLVQDIAKQIAACPNVVYVKLDDIPEAIREQEKRIAMGSDTLKGKPENIKEKIVQGKLDKTLRELCLLDQAYIKDQSITVEELIKQTVATLGENIQVRRFSRFILGEGLEKKESSLAEEVAAQMGTKSEAPASTADSPATETKTESPSEGATGKTEVPAQTKKDGFATTPPKDKAKKKGKSKKKGK